MTDQTTDTLAALNSYDGDNIWEDLVYGLPGYNDALTHGDESRDVVIDGIHYYHDSQQGGWIVWGRAAAVTNVYRYDLHVAQGGDPGQHLDGYVTVDCPIDYDPATLTADDILHDPSIVVRAS